MIASHRDVSDAEYNTPLLIASQRKKYETIKVLLDFGVDVNVKNNNGNAPIHQVLRYGFNRQEVTCSVKLLLDYGADINLQGENGTKFCYMFNFIRNHFIRNLLIFYHIIIVVGKQKPNESLKNHVKPFDKCFDIG